MWPTGPEKSSKQAGVYSFWVCSFIFLLSNSVGVSAAGRDSAAVRDSGNLPRVQAPSFPPRITSTSPCFRLPGAPPGSFEFEINGQFLRDYGPGNNFPTAVYVKQGKGHSNPIGAININWPILENTNTRILVRLDPGKETVGIFVQTWAGVAKACDFTFVTPPKVKVATFFKTIDDFNKKRPTTSLPASGGIVWVSGESLIDPVRPNARTFTIGGNPVIGGLVTSQSLWDVILQIPPRAQIPDHPDPSLKVTTACSTCPWTVPLQFVTQYGKSQIREVRLQR